MSLTPEDTDLFLRLAGEGTYHCSVRDAMRRRGYLLMNRFIPHPRVSHAYHAFARPVAAWTVESLTPGGRHDMTAVLGRRRVGVIAIADDSSSTLSRTSVHHVPALMADHMGLSPRASLEPGRPLTTTASLDIDRRPDTWITTVARDVEPIWPAMARDIGAGRWHLWRSTRNCRYDGDEPAGDVTTVLDTPAGMLRVDPRPGTGTVRLWPTTPGAEWERLTDGPDVSALEHTEGWRRLQMAGTTVSPLSHYRRARPER